MIQIETLTQLSGRRLRLWRELLCGTGLTPDDHLDVSILLWQDEELVATGSRRDNILKCIAVSPSHQGEGLTATVLTHLRQEAFSQGHRHLFLYTKPENRAQFQSLLFYPVAQTDTVLLLEDKRQGINAFLDALPVSDVSGTIGAVVMNCNPFTLGHRYLAETAARECDHLYAFILSEDKSYFSTRDRMAMAEAGMAHLPNVTVLPTGPYLISSATFPTYFLKDREAATEVQCLLDIEVFLNYFVPRFGITRRYVGTEPFSPMTGMYNRALKLHLPSRGIELREIPRLELNHTPISASALRHALTTADWETAKTLVPATTLAYLEEHRPQ